MHKQFDTVVVQLGLDVQILPRERLGIFVMLSTVSSQRALLNRSFTFTWKEMIYFLKCDFNTCLLLCTSEGDKIKNQIKISVSVVSKPQGQIEDMNISVVMILATSMSDVKMLTVSIFSFRINYSFYLWYLFLLSIFHHHFVPS